LDSAPYFPNTTPDPLITHCWLPQG
jgi:hypothetical protein